jgi:hypothetical protein
VLELTICTADELQDRSQLGTKTASVESFTQVKTWLHACNSGHAEHSECSYIAECQMRRRKDQQDQHFVPTRLLDLEPAEPAMIRLVDTHTTQLIQGPYATLSHKWGKIKDEERFQLTKDTKDDLYSGFQIDSIRPQGKTFQEAIEVTQRLGIRYLWIDSLCISQGDKEEWLREGATMDQVYMNSYVNLAAVDSEDTSCGLYSGDRNPDELPPDIVEYRGSQYALLLPTFWKQQILDRPLYCRGWVLQGKSILHKLICHSTDGT